MKKKKSIDWIKQCKIQKSHMIKYRLEFVGWFISDANRMCVLVARPCLQGLK